MKSKYIASVIFLFLIGFSCSPEKNNSLAESKTSPVKGLANPAAVKCIRDGYELKPIEENGVSKGYFCVNKKTGMKCEIWSYFRGECDLTP
jgi:putative hemolysin